MGERSGYIRIYLNTGSDASPAFGSYSNLKVGGSDFQMTTAKPEVVDWNNDGLPDIVCGEDNGGVLLLLNTGTAGSPAFSSSQAIQSGGSAVNVDSRSSPAVADLNGDGKKDLLVGAADGKLYFYENTGSDSAPAFSGRVTLSAGGSTISVGNYSRPEIADWDGDGKLDIVCGSYDGAGHGYVWLFKAVSSIPPGGGSTPPGGGSTGASSDSGAASGSPSVPTVYSTPSPSGGGGGCLLACPAGSR